jgi:hypothetical protein
MSRYYRVKTLMLKGEKGETGYSISNIQMNDDYTLTITIENGMQFNTPPIRGEKGEQGTGIRSVELRDDYSLLFTLDDGETLETTAILGKEFENIRKLEASATSASKIATNASTSASASAQSAKNASQSATNAQESASNASTSADTATSKATEASASATKAKECEMNAKLSETNASNSAKEAEASAVNAKTSENKAKEYANNLQNSTEAINQLKEDLNANTKADARTNRSLTALWDLNKGISYRFESDVTKAYQKQIPSGAKLGAVNKIGGRTIVYNQLFTTENYDSDNLKITYADNVITINGSISNNWINFSPLGENLNIVAKFYIKMTIIKNDGKLSFNYGWLNRSCYTDSISTGSSSAIYNQTTSELEKGPSTGISWADSLGSVTFNDVKIKIMIVNLTKMFGSGNEPSTVEEFEAMFPNDYYAYNEGELMSMSVNEVDSVGKNYFDFSKIKMGSLVDYDKQTITIPHDKYSVGGIQTLRELCPNITPGTYVLSMNRSNPKSANFIYLIGYGNSITINRPIELTNKHLNSKIALYNANNAEVENVISNIQIEKATTATTYSPYTKATYTIPQAILNLDGYGWGVGTAYNYVDFENKKYYKCVGRYVVTGDEYYMSNENLGYIGNNSSNAYFVKNIGHKPSPYESCISNKLKRIAYCWSVDSAYNTMEFNGEQIHIRILNSELGITSETSPSEVASAVKKYCKGLYDKGDPIIIYYELAEPVVTDISDIIGDTLQEPFKVESGGSLTFKNVNGDGYKLAVPSDIQYVVSLKEVTS